jgi:UDP-2,3-diacylglucosamine hydrolase
VLVADAHLGGGSSVAEEAFHRFLSTVPDMADELLINGDLFDFWFEYRSVVPRRHFGTIARLHELRRRGVAVSFIGGNHDRWGGDFLRRDLGIAFYSGEAELTLAGRRAYVAHGDGLTEQHFSAKLLHRITRHPLTIGLFRALHPDVGFWIAQRLSGHLADGNHHAERDRAARAQAEYACGLLTQRPELGLVIMAHTHRPALECLPGNRVYVNPGAWFDGFRYALITNSDVELRNFEE